jgi:hypothetical protein
LAQGRKFYVKRGNRVEILPDAQELMAVFPIPGGKQVKLIQAGQFARLYRNEGDGTFVEVSKQAGIHDNGLSLSFSSSSMISVSRYFGKNQLHAKPGGDLSHYAPRPKEEQIPPMGGFQQQWINACKTDLETSCDMDYSGTAIEQMLLGLVAYRVGKKIDYDAKTGCVTNSDEANALLSKTYRDGWPLDG